MAKANQSSSYLYFCMKVLQIMLVILLSITRLQAFTKYFQMNNAKLKSSGMFSTSVSYAHDCLLVCETVPGCQAVNVGQDDQSRIIYDIPRVDNETRLCYHPVSTTMCK